jgi:hypothetical protein
MTPPVDPAAIVLRLRSIIDLAGGVTVVSRQSGLNGNTLDGYYRGASLPGALAIGCLCRALEISADWLLFGEVQP